MHKQAHSAYLASIPHYDIYMRYSGHPPIVQVLVASLQAQIAEAQTELKRGIDADWCASVLRYQVVLDCIYSLVELHLPDDSDPVVTKPPFAAAGYADRGDDMAFGVSGHATGKVKAPQFAMTSQGGTSNDQIAAHATTGEIRAESTEHVSGTSGRTDEVQELNIENWRSARR